ncbi:MAG: HEAT repeat domain-containing protein [bacterium]
MRREKANNYHKEASYLLGISGSLVSAGCGKEASVWEAALMDMASGDGTRWQKGVKTFLGAGSEVREFLVSVLGKDERAVVRRQASYLLWQCGAQEAGKEVLTHMKGETDPATLINCMTCLKAWRTPGAGPVILKYLNHTDLEVSVNAAWCLGAFPKVSHLKERLSEIATAPGVNPRVKRGAIHSLGMISSGAKPQPRETTAKTSIGINVRPR